MSMNHITHVVVHYSATFEDQNLTVKDVDRMHKARGWKGVGYHYVIRRDGVVDKGRPDNVVGAHVAGQNSGKIGICCIGGCNRATGPDKGVDNRTPAQKAALIALIKTLLARYPKAKVVGHRDLAATQCPGFDVIPWWASVVAGETAPKPDTDLGDVQDWPLLRKGAKGHAVMLLQQALAKGGLPLSPDGDFGPKTEAAVKKFQKSRSLVADGIVGPYTWAALLT